jgi:hypothetical protein
MMAAGALVVRLQNEITPATVYAYCTKKNEFIFHQSLDRMMEKGVTYYNGMGTEPLLIKSDVSKKNRVKKNKREKQKIRIHVHWHS